MGSFVSLVTRRYGTQHRRKKGCLKFTDWIGVDALGSPRDSRLIGDLASMPRETEEMIVVSTFSVKI
jgi:hypothetical protein